jgi:hypothetical protein
MNKFLGGEIEILLEDFYRGSFSVPTASLPMPYTYWLDTGRSALYIALEDILRKGCVRKAWLPAYGCESILSQFKAHGFEINFYSVGQSFTEPEGLPPELHNEVFLYIHYFGKKNTAIEAWISDRISQGDKFYIIEDCVQASLNLTIGNIGDYAITSYRKCLAQPDGALLGSKTYIDLKVDMPDESFISRRLLGKLLRQQNNAEGVFLTLFEESESVIDKQNVPRTMSWVSKFLMARMDIKSISEKRQKNYKFLLSLLSDFELVGNRLSVIFNTFESEEVPLGFPIRVHENRRNDLRKFLSDHKIYCAVHWNLDHLSHTEEWIKEISLSEQMLTLPIDQRLNEQSLEYIANTIMRFCNEK